MIAAEMARSRRARDARRIERGDWQTPDDLAAEMLQALYRTGRTPRSVLEPTCGEGSLLAAAARCFPEAELVGFDISERYVALARERLPSTRARVEVGNFFELPWETLLDALPEPLLVVGNPPWVTSSQLGVLGADNLPEKANVKNLPGLEALTGKSNFDISEWMLCRLLEAAQGRRFTLAMLCKASVARRVLEHCAARGWALDGELRTIDARVHFSANVDAVLLHVTSSETTEPREDARFPLYPSLGAAAPGAVLGVVAGRLASNVDAFLATRSLEGTSAHVWRSGLKHDAAKVMELDVTGSLPTNGLGEVVDVEEEHVFPLLKGSDVANGRLAPRRAVIVTQRKLGEDTLSLRERAPKLWSYLEAHREALGARKSSIYREQPPFAMFGVGPYSFAPFKVAISGLYKKLSFSVLRPHDGRPVMVDDTVYFLACETEKAAETLAKALGSSRARDFFEARVFWDAKRPVGKALLQSLSLEALLGATARG